MEYSVHGHWESWRWVKNFEDRQSRFGRFESNADDSTLDTQLFHETKIFNGWSWHIPIVYIWLPIVRAAWTLLQLKIIRNRLVIYYIYPNRHHLSQQKSIIPIFIFFSAWDLRLNRNRIERNEQISYLNGPILGIMHSFIIKHKLWHLCVHRIIESVDCALGIPFKRPRAFVFEMNSVPLEFQRCAKSNDVNFQTRKAPHLSSILHLRVPSRWQSFSHKFWAAKDGCCESLMWIITRILNFIQHRGSNVYYYSIIQCARG